MRWPHNKHGLCTAIRHQKQWHNDLILADSKLLWILLALRDRDAIHACHHNPNPLCTECTDSERANASHQNWRQSFLGALLAQLAAYRTNQAPHLRFTTAPVEFSEERQLYSGVKREYSL